MKELCKFWKVVHFWRLSKIKRKYYSFLQATQTSKAVLTFPFGLWLNHLISEASQMEKSKFSFPSFISFHYTFRFFVFWLTRSRKSRLCYYLWALLWSNSSYLSFTRKATRELAMKFYWRKERLIQGKTTWSRQNFWKQGPRWRKKIHFLGEARKTSVLKLFLFVVVHCYSNVFLTSSIS